MRMLLCASENEQHELDIYDISFHFVGCDVYACPCDPTYSNVQIPGPFDCNDMRPVVC